MFWKALLGLILGSVGGTLIALILLSMLNAVEFYLSPELYTPGVLAKMGSFLIVGLFGGALVGLGLATRE